MHVQYQHVTSTSSMGTSSACAWQRHRSRCHSRWVTGTACRRSIGAMVRSISACMHSSRKTRKRVFRIVACFFRKKQVLVSFLTTGSENTVFWVFARKTGFPVFPVFFWFFRKTRLVVHAPLWGDPIVVFRKTTMCKNHAVFTAPAAVTRLCMAVTRAELVLTLCAWHAALLHCSYECMTTVPGQG